MIVELGIVSIEVARDGMTISNCAKSGSIKCKQDRAVTTKNRTLRNCKNGVQPPGKEHRPAGPASSCLT